MTLADYILLAALLITLLAMAPTKGDGPNNSPGGPGYA